MFTAEMNHLWTDDELQRLVVRRKRFAKEETELLALVKNITKEQWQDDDWRYIGKELKTAIQNCQQNVKCCTMLLDYFNGKLAKCNVSDELEIIFMLCSAELAFGPANEMA